MSCQRCAVLQQELDETRAMLERSYPLRCRDCGTPYTEFGLDTVLTDDQWALIHPEGAGGVLCAGCIVKRASRLEKSVVVRATIEFTSEANK